MHLSSKIPMLMTWDEHFSQDDGIIDEQHRAIISTINSIHYLFLKQDETNLIRHIIILHSQCQVHFRTELLLLKQYDSPLVENYELAAERFLDALLDIIDVKNDDHQTQRLFETFKTWWNQHLALHEDIAPYLTKWDGEYCRVVA